MACIYKITNLINNKVYIGKTTRSVQIRFREHLSKINHKRYKNDHLSNSIREYGRENFICEILTEGDYNINLLNSLEKHYVRLYNSNNSKIGYNLTDGGQHILMSKEQRLKISKSHTQRNPVTKLTKQRLKEAHKRLLRNGYKHGKGVFVNQYNLNGILIRTFETVWDAARNLKVCPKTIMRWSNGEVPKVKRDYTVKIINTKKDE